MHKTNWLSIKYEFGGMGKMKLEKKVVQPLRCKDCLPFFFLVGIPAMGIGPMRAPAQAGREPSHKQGVDTLSHASEDATPGWRNFHPTGQLLVLHLNLPFEGEEYHARVICPRV